MMALARATWSYRNFIRGSVRRELEARYTHSLLGSIWAILHPITMIVIYAVVFTQTIQARIEGVEHGNLIKKLQFPRI